MRLVRNRSVPAIIPSPSHEQLGNACASIRVATPRGRGDALGPGSGAAWFRRISLPRSRCTPARVLMHGACTHAERETHRALEDGGGTVRLLADRRVVDKFARERWKGSAHAYCLKRLVVPTGFEPVSEP